MINPFFKNFGPFAIDKLLSKINIRNNENYKKDKIYNVADLVSATQKDLTFLHSSKYSQIASNTKASYCVTLDSLNIRETLPIIKNCNVAICNDTSFSHLSSALGIKTITLMADTPLIYGSYNTNMYPIIPDGEITVSHNTRGKDKINPDKVYEKLLSIIN